MSRLPLICVPLLAFLLVGCQSARQYQNSSVVDYLYPKSEQQAVEPAVPTLTLPLQVGIAFTPGRYGGASALTEAHKMELLKKIGDHFEDLDFVDVTLELNAPGPKAGQGHVADFEWVLPPVQRQRALAGAASGEPEYLGLPDHQGAVCSLGCLGVGGGL